MFKQTMIPLIMFTVACNAIPIEPDEVLDRDWESICGDACAGPPVDVDVGDGTSCVRYEGGAVLCWGIRRGVLDNYDMRGTDWAALAPSQPRPQVVLAGQFYEDPNLPPGNDIGGDGRSDEEKRGILDAVDLSVSRDTACVVRRDGTLWCWGRNLRGELARGRDNRSPSKWPVQAVGEPGQDAGHIVSIEVGGAGVCAIREDGTAVAAIERLWFDDTHYYDACVPAMQVTCAIYDGDIWCRGEDSFGLLGGGEVTPEGARVAEVEDAVQLSISASHACALTQDGDVWCWGSNVYGEVGRIPLTEGNNYRTSPARVEGVDDISQIETAGSYSCALREDNQLLCWGNDKTGILGTHSDRGSVPHPLEIPDADDIIDVSLAANHGCIIRENGEVACWGSDLYGAIGPERGYAPYGTFQTVRGLPHHGDWPSSD